MLSAAILIVAGPSSAASDCPATLIGSTFIFLLAWRCSFRCSSGTGARTAECTRHVAGLRNARDLGFRSAAGVLDRRGLGLGRRPPARTWRLGADLPGDSLKARAFGRLAIGPDPPAEPGVLGEMEQLTVSRLAKPLVSSTMQSRTFPASSISSATPTLPLLARAPPASDSWWTGTGRAAAAWAAALPETPGVGLADVPHIAQLARQSSNAALTPLNPGTATVHRTCPP